MSSLPDLVIRVGQPSEELRYTVRSLAKNLPHRKMWLAGVEVPWLNLPLIHVPQVPGKYVHAYLVLRAILTSQALTTDVIVADDDMYAMKPMSRLVAYHQGPLSKLASTTPTRTRAIRQTIPIVGPEALCRDNHTPSLVNRARLLEQLGTLNIPESHKALIMWRTLHANGEPRYLSDVKVRDAKTLPTDAAWLSTNGYAWDGAAGAHIRACFPEPSLYET